MTAGYDTGLAALQQAISSSKGGGNGSRLNYITWKENETKVVRFLTDEVISAQFAERVQCNNGKTQDFMINPDKGDFVAKYGGQAFNRDTHMYGPPRLGKKGCAVAVLRMEYPDPANPGRSRVADAPQTTEANGQSFNGRFFGVIKQGLQNFWHPVLGAAERYSTLIDRDWAIKRIGGDKNTIYIPTPLSPDGDPDLEALRDPATLAQYYGYGKPWDENDPNRFYFCPQTLVDWADYYSGEERAKFWLVNTRPAAPAGMQQQPPTVTGYPPLGFPGVPGQVQAPAYAPQAYPAPQVYPAPPPQPQMPAPPVVAQQPVGYPPQVAPAIPMPAPPPAPSGYGEFHPATTQNPPQVANAPLPVQGSAPVLSTATGVPVIHQQPVPPPPAPPSMPVAPPAAPAAQQGGPWGSSEDEAQAVPSNQTSWANLQSQLMPHITAEAQAAAAQAATPPVPAPAAPQAPAAAAPTAQ